jgi:hypothetical protein
LCGRLADNKKEICKSVCSKGPSFAMNNQTDNPYFCSVRFARGMSWMTILQKSRLCLMYDIECNM